MHHLNTNVINTFLFVFLNEILNLMQLSIYTVLDMTEKNLLVSQWVTMAMFFNFQTNYSKLLYEQVLQAYLQNNVVGFFC